MTWGKIGGIVSITCGNGVFFLRAFRFRAKGSPCSNREAIRILHGPPGAAIAKSLQAGEPAYIYKEVPLGMRVKITLRCNECKQRNYNTVKNKKNDPDRLEMKKYCPFCRKHTVHSETK